jgi:hypothetical protein
MKKIILLGVFSLFIFFSSVSLVSAANEYACQCNDGKKYATSDCTACDKTCNNDTASCQKAGSSSGSSELPNPLGIKDLNTMIARLINFVLSFVGSISLLMFLYGGIIWMTSAGAPDKVKKGRDIIVWSVIGLAVVFSSYILVRLVIEGLTTKAPV